MALLVLTLSAAAAAMAAALSSFDSSQLPV